MQNIRKVILAAGIIGGLLFAIHVSIPNCGAWPFIWPALTGLTAVWSATRERTPHWMRDTLTTALTTAVLFAAVALVAVFAIVYVVLHTNLFPSIQQIAPPQRSIATLATLPVAAGLAGIDLLIVFVVGLLVVPVRYFQTRQAGA
jgi:hypothetical protein